MIITDRDYFIGGHVTKTVWQSLKVEARKRSTSVSRLIYVLLRDSLSKMGYTCK